MQGEFLSFPEFSEKKDYGNRINQVFQIINIWLLEISLNDGFISLFDGHLSNQSTRASARTCDKNIFIFWSDTRQNSPTSLKWKVTSVSLPVVAELVKLHPSQTRCCLIIASWSTVSFINWAPKHQFSKHSVSCIQVSILKTIVK